MQTLRVNEYDMTYLEVGQTSAPPAARLRARVTV